jgi:hypothetical protein
MSGVLWSEVQPLKRTAIFVRCLEPTQTPIQWVPGSLSPRVNRQGCEAEHLTPFRVEEQELYLHSPTRLHGTVYNCVIKYRDNSALTLVCPEGNSKGIQVW